MGEMIMMMLFLWNIDQSCDNAWSLSIWSKGLTAANLSAQHSISAAADMAVFVTSNYGARMAQSFNDASVPDIG